MSIGLEGFVRKKTKINLGGKDFVFTELSIRDLAAFRAELMDKRKNFNQERREQLIKVAEKIGNINQMELLKYIDKPLTEEEIEAEMETIDGMGYLVYLSLKYCHPEITKEDAMSIISPSKLPEITKALFPASEEIKKDEDDSIKKK